MNNDILNYSVSILNDVLIKNVPFAIAVKQTFKKGNVDKEIRKSISTLTGCELRHHLIFVEITKNFFGDISLEILIPICLIHANNLFIKEFDYEDIIDYVKELLNNHDISYTREALKEYFNSCLDTKNLIPNKYDKNSFEFLSFRYNTPTWLIKMWNKTYGRGLTLKILKANSKAPLNTNRVNTNLISTEDFLENHPLYEQAFISDVVVYKGTLPFKKQKALLENKIFPQKMGYKYLTDRVDIDPLKGVAIYQGASSNFYLEVSLRGKFSNPMDLITSSYQDYYETSLNIEKFGINNMKVYQAEASSIITCVSKKVNTFFVLPRSSCFELLRSTPDYFNRFNAQTLDDLISEQYLALCECSSFVEDGGNLIYIIPTLSNKEGHKNIFRFLKEHKDFRLVEERQLFPFDPYDSSLYFAILRKEGNDD